jgi:hypothetical protein
VFDLIEESFDEIAFAVEREIAEPLDKPVGFGWNDNVCAIVCDEFHNGICVIALVGQNADCSNVFQKRLCLGAVGNVSGRQDQAKWIAARIAEGVEFCGQSAA